MGSNTLRHAVGWHLNVDRQSYHNLIPRAFSLMIFITAASPEGPWQRLGQVVQNKMAAKVEFEIYLTKWKYYARGSDLFFCS